MFDMMETIRKHKSIFLFWIILFIGTAVRLYGLGTYPAGVHRDEAYAGYEAYSILTEGTDSWGYHNSIYFVSWGSGMNVLETYLMIPFVKVLGLTALAIRIPQAILQIVALCAFYLLLKKLKNKEFALLGMFLLAICPWHILFSRWGLESFLSIPMLLLGTFFLVKGTEPLLNQMVDAKQSIQLLWAAIFYGLDLYCYSATWIPLAGNLLLFIIYVFFYMKKNKRSIEKSVLRNMILAIVVLLLFALPLFMFILVNVNVMDEIRSFISIPRHVDFRGDELFNVKTFSERFELLRDILIFQNHNQLCSSYPPFGMFYLFSGPFIVCGLVVAVKETICAWKENKFSYSLILLVYVVTSYVIAIVQGISIIRTSFIQIAVVILWAKGIYFLVEKVRKRLIAGIIISVYIVAFSAFVGCYFTDYQEKIAVDQHAGVEVALEEAHQYIEAGKADKICLSRWIEYPYVLFYTKMPSSQFRQEVVWKNYPYKYLVADSIGEYVWDNYEENGLSENYIYILDAEEKTRYENQGFTFKQCGEVFLAYR